MDRKQLIITLGILLCFPVFAHAGVSYFQVRRNVKHGEFASVTGVFNSHPNIANHGEFTAKGLFRKELIFNDAGSQEFKAPVGIFNLRSVDKSSTPDSIFNIPQGEFSSRGLISSFMKFSLPR